MQRILVGLVALIAVVEGLATGMIPMASLLLVLAGLVYGAMNVDAESPSEYLLVALGAHLAASSDVLGSIPAIGMQLDGIVGGLSMAITAGVVSVIAMRVVNRLKG